MRWERGSAVTSEDGEGVHRLVRTEWFFVEPPAHEEDDGVQDAGERPTPREGQGLRPGRVRTQGSYEVVCEDPSEGRTRRGVPEEGGGPPRIEPTCPPEDQGHGEVDRWACLPTQGPDCGEGRGQVEAQEDGPGEGDAEDHTHGAGNEEGPLPGIESAEVREGGEGQTEAHPAQE